MFGEVMGKSLVSCFFLTHSVDPCTAVLRCVPPMPSPLMTLGADDILTLWADGSDGE